MSKTPRLFKPTVVTSLLITTGILGMTFMPGLFQARASPASFTLYGRINTPAGWGFTSSTVASPGPDLIVAPGEAVTMSLTSGDSFNHNWGVDYNGNGFIDDAEPISSNFGSTGTTYTFTATTTPGTYRYWCFIHKGPMFGNFIVQSPAVPDFSISAGAATPASFVAGNSATSTITLTSLNSFAGSVNLAASTTAPVTGVTFSFSMNPVTLTAGGTGTSTLTISTATSTPVGTYTITVTGTGTGGSPSHSATTAVTVVGPDFSVSSSPTTLSIVQGSSGNSTITLTSLNGFAGSVTLGVGVYPTGPAASVSPVSVALSSGGTGTAVVKISTSAGAYSSTATGPYTITITGTSGSLSHPATVSITVTSSNSSPLGVGNIPVSVLIGVIAAVVAVIVVAVILVRRRPKT